MNYIDIALSVILLFGLIRGFLKGFFVEVTSLVALAAGIYVAINFSFFVGNFLAGSVNWGERYIQISAFIITFVVVVLFISLLGKILTTIAEAAALGVVNKIFGAVFGFLKVGLILSISLIVFATINNTVHFVKKENLSSSILYKPVKNLAPILFPSILKIEKGTSTN